MAVRSITKAGQISFRGLGWVKIDGILYPVCGSKSFNLSATSAVVYNPNQVEMVPVEEDRKAIFPVYCDLDRATPVGTIRFSPNGETNGKVIFELGITEGIPNGLVFENTVFDNFRLVAPFRWVLPGSAGATNPQGSAAASAREIIRGGDNEITAQFPGTFDNGFGGMFYSEIYIP